MLIMTNERCPECDSIIYMQCYPKKRDDGSIILPVDCDDGPHAIADGCYLDRDAVFCITRFDENTSEPSYVCILCKWRV